MNRTTVTYLGGSAALVAILALVRPTPPPPPTEDARLADIPLIDPGPDVPLLRSVARQRLAREVIEGQRSVFAAAALFRALDRVAPTLEPPRPERGFPLPVPFLAATADEAYCRHVARWAYLMLKHESPARAIEVVVRLAAEVRAEVAARVAVRLPDPATLEPVERLLAEARAALQR